MELELWLKKEKKTKRWLSVQIGVTEGLVYNMFKRKKRRGIPLPYTWIPAILRLTNYEVSIDDEWPESRRTKKKSNAVTDRQKTKRIQSRNENSSMAKEKMGKPDFQGLSQGDRA